MASKNKRKKAKNSFIYNLGSLKNSIKRMKMKHVLFYTSKDRKENKQIKIEENEKN